MCIAYSAVSTVIGVALLHGIEATGLWQTSLLSATTGGVATATILQCAIGATIGAASFSLIGLYYQLEENERGVASMKRYAYCAGVGASSMLFLSANACIIPMLGLSPEAMFAVQAVAMLMTMSYQATMLVIQDEMLKKIYKDKGYANDMIESLSENTKKHVINQHHRACLSDKIKNFFSSSPTVASPIVASKTEASPPSSESEEMSDDDGSGNKEHP